MQDREESHWQEIKSNLQHLKKKYAISQKDYKEAEIKILRGLYYAHIEGKTRGFSSAFDEYHKGIKEIKEKINVRK